MQPPEIPVNSFGKCIVLTEPVVPNEPYTDKQVEYWALALYESILMNAALFVEDDPNAESRKRQYPLRRDNLFLASTNPAEYPCKTNTIDTSNQSESKSDYLER